MTVTEVCWYIFLLGIPTPITDISVLVVIFDLTVCFNLKEIIFMENFKPSRNFHAP